MPQAWDMLRAEGCLLAYENGNSALFARPLADDAMLTRSFERDTLRLAQSLLDQLKQRPDRHPYVVITVHLHLGEIDTAGDTVVGGPLLDLQVWVAPIANQLNADIVVGSAAVVANLDTPVSPLSISPPCYRIQQPSERL